MISLFNPVKPNVILVTELLCKIKQIKITKDTIKKELLKHPNFPSLLSLSDFLDDFNVENVAATFDSGKIQSIPLPFITTVKNKPKKKDYMTIVRDTNGQFVSFYDYENSNWAKLPFEDFTQIWSGLALLVNSNSESGENGYEVKLKTSRIKMLGWIFPLALLLIALCMINCLPSGPIIGMSPIQSILFLTLTALGCITSIGILWLELDLYSPILQKICNMNSNRSCSTVLNSKGAKIFGIKWSVIGFSYFVGGLLTIILSGSVNPDTRIILYCLGILSSIYIIYSVIFQWLIVKRWCTLCLIIQGILAIQLVLILNEGFPNLYELQIVSSKSYFSISFVYILAYFLSSTLMPIFPKARESARYKKDFELLKKSKSIFKALLSNEKLVQDPRNLGIKIGKDNAINKIIKVCNPYCEPCSFAHKALQELLLSNQDIQIQIIFTASIDDNDKKREPVRHLLAIADNNDKELTKNALDTWYISEIKDYLGFAAKFPIDTKLIIQDAKIASMWKWCNDNDIAHTPTLFVNGHRLPEIYKITDLKALLH